MSEPLRLFFVILLLTVGLIAYFLVANALFPRRVARTKSAIQSMPGRSLGIGLVNVVFFAAIALMLFSLGDNAEHGFVKAILVIPALLITAFLAVMLSFGLAGMTNILGERIFSDLPTWKQTASGTACLSFACALPFVGWFLLLPYVGFVGVGAVILGLFQREKN